MFSRVFLSFYNASPNGLSKHYIFCPCFNFTPRSMLLSPGLSVGFSKILMPFYCLQVTVRRGDEEKQKSQQVGFTEK